MRKKILTLLALLVLLPVMVFATEVVITWEWMLDDPQITGFRYQLDGEDPDNWTVVDSMTSSCVIENLDGSKEYTLYLQQTYDGVNWSPSAVSVAMPLFSEEEMAVEDVEAVAVEDEEAIAVEDEEAIVVEDEEAVAVEDEEAIAVEDEEAIAVEDEEAIAVEDEEAIAVEDEEKITKEENVLFANTSNEFEDDYYTTLSLRGSAAYTKAPVSGTLTTYDQYSAAIGLGLGFNNIIPLNNIGLGLNIDTDFILLPHNGQALNSLKSFLIDSSITDYGLRVTIAPEVELSLNRFSVDIAPFVDATLVDYSIFDIDYSPDYFSHFVIGYGAKLGINFNASDNLQLGVAAKARKYGGMANWNDLDEWGVEVTPTLSLRF